MGGRQMLKTTVEWGSIERVPCVIKLLPTPKSQAGFHVVIFG